MAGITTATTPGLMTTETELLAAEEELFQRFGMSPNQAFVRFLVLFCIGTVAVLLLSLPYVELFVVYAYEGDHTACSWFLAGRATLSGIISLFTSNVIGAIADRVGRKPFFLISQIAGGIIVGVHAFAAENPSFLVMWGWVSAVFGFVSAMFFIVSMGYLKDCVPHSIFNDIDVPCAPNGARRWTSIKQFKALAVSGIVCGVCAAILVFILEEVFKTTGLQISVGLAGGLWSVASIYTYFFIPETVDPVYRKANTVTDYFKSGEWRNDANPFRNIGYAIKQGFAIRIYMLWVFIVSLSNSTSSLAVQYILVRWGMTTQYLALYAILLVLSSLFFLSFSTPILRSLGEAPVSIYSQLLGGAYRFGGGIIGSLFWIANPVGVGVLLWAPLWGSCSVGLLVANSVPQRLADYNAQATISAALWGVSSLGDACLRFLNTGLFVYGLNHTKLTDYTVHKDCSNDDELRSHCLDAYTTSNASVACDIIVASNCHCVWKAEHCRDMPNLFEAQGSSFDILSLPWFVTGVLSIGGSFLWIYFVLKTSPFARAAERRDVEVLKWKEKRVGMPEIKSVEDSLGELGTDGVNVTDNLHGDNLQGVDDEQHG